MKAIIYICVSLLFLLPTGSSFAASGVGQFENAYNRALSDITNYPKDSLKRAKDAVKSGTLRVVFWGDSITEGYDQISYRDCYAYRVEEALRDALPGVNVISANYSLKSRDSTESIDPNYKGLASEPSDPALGFHRPWSVVGQSWIDTVKKFNPDLIIYAFGMNDVYYHPKDADKVIANNTISLINTIKTWTSAPSLVIVPTMLPTKDTAIYSQDLNITNATARSSREVGKNYGVAVADANRIFQILRDGVDDVTRWGKREKNFEGYDTSAWLGAVNEFNLNGGVLTPMDTSFKFVTRNRNFYNGTIKTDIKPVNSTDTAWIRYREYGDYGSLIVFITPGHGTGSIGIYDDKGNAISNETNLDIPFSEYSKITIDVNGSHHKVYLNNNLVLDAVIYQKLFDGYISLGSFQSSVVYANLEIDYQDPLTVETPYTETELLGAYNSSESGNGINHPSGKGHALIYFPAFNGLIRQLSDSN